ncbi:MAG: hypothetical protein FK733_19250 [Asgard group archaeon]|nr:hypothetical protein [Asgard group archaeon]
MVKKKSILILILAMLVTQVLILQPNISSKAIYNTDENQSIIINNYSQNEVITPGPSGMEIVKTNTFSEGGMEEENSNGEPEALYGYGTGNNYANHSYQDEVYSGSYGAKISSRGSLQYSSSHYTYRYLPDISERSYLDEDITLDMWYNAKANPDFTRGAEQYIRLQVMSNLGNVYINYYLSRVSGIPINQTTTAFFDLRGPLNTWTNLVRNITLDITQAFPTVDPSVSYIRYFYVWVTSVFNPAGDNIMLFDDVAFRNSTSFNYLSHNGDFEDGDSYPWNDSAQGEGSLYRTTSDYTEGSSAANITAQTLGLTSSPSSYIFAETEIYDGWGSIPKSYSPNNPGDTVFSFDWKYSDTPGIGRQYAYFYLYFTNGSYDCYLNFILGDENDDLTSFSNYSYSSYSAYFIKAESFGSRNAWERFTFDAYEIINTFNKSNIVPFYLGFYADVYNAPDTKVQLLVDDFRIITYPAVDPSFEFNIIESTADPFNFWQDSHSHYYNNITSDAYDGNYAANITSYGGSGNVRIYRNTFLPVIDNLYTDFYWRLDELTDIGNQAFSRIRIELDESYYIHYILGNNSYFSLTNNSNNCYYFAEDHNQIGTWNNLFRNVSDDVYNAFGIDNWNITQIYINSYATGTEATSTIFDHIYFVTDVTGPSITNPIRNPSSPEYGEEVDISVDVQDNIQVQSVELFVKVDAGSWIPTPMTYVAGDYTATIQGYDFGTSVSYYFIADDIYGHQTQLGSDVSPYSYLVGDDVPPIVAITSPIQSAILIDEILIEVFAEDTGSGIDYVEFFVDAISLGTDSIAPYNVLWDTTTIVNGSYTISAVAYDNNGNSDFHEIPIEVNNDYYPPVISDLQLTPARPLHNLPVEVTLMADDHTGVASILLFYKIDNGTWIDTPMTHNGTMYVGDLPAIKLKQTMYYYIQAEDTLGHISTLGSSTVPFEYTIKLTGMMFLYRYFIPIASGSVAIGIVVLVLVLRRKRLKA